LREGDHLLISDLEHNAVWRPVCRLAREGRISYGVFPSFARSLDRSATRITHAIEEMIRPNTRMLVCTHASNICSITMPIREIGALCRRRGIFFVVDGAQSAGALPISMEEDCIDALCLPGHKGLFGAQGCGALILGEGIYADTLIEGGSGLNSLDEAMPDDSPERYEAGTLPTPSLAGLCEGLKFLKEVGIENVFRREQELCALMRDRLSDLRGVELSAPHAEGGILLITSPRMPSDALGAELDRRGICVRSGFHCAALAHRTLESPGGGALRVSVGYFNRPSDADALRRALREILG
jgi:selenocysteine lyase/cysteine desulfurase